MKNNFFTILRKEISSYFASYVGYLAIFIYLVFSFLTSFYGSGVLSSKSIVLEEFFIYQPQILLGLIPLLLMRSFSEERKTDVFEVTMSLPVKLGSLVYAKFFAAFFIGILMLASTIPFVVYMSIKIDLDIINIIGIYLMFACIIAMFCSISLFFSSFSSSAIVSYILSTLAIWTIISFELLFVLNPIVSILLPDSLELLYALSFRTHMIGFFNGNINIASFVYYLSFVIMFLILTVYILSPLTKNKIKKSIKISSMLFFIIFVLNIFSMHFLLNHKIDITSNKRHSLSQDTKDMLKDLETPINVKIYISKDLSIRDYSYSSYAYKVISFLKKYETFENISIDIRQVVPNSLEEKEAYISGLSSFLTSDGEEFIYFGAVLSNKTGESRTISNFVPNRDSELESDISILIRELSGKKKYKIGWVNALDKNRDDNMLKALLLEDYDMVNITHRAIFIPANQIDALVVSNFQSIGYTLSYAIDQYILQGGKVLMMLDNRYAIEDNSYPKEILRNLGIDYDYEMVVTDSNLANMVVSHHENIEGNVSKKITSLKAGLNNIYKNEINNGIKSVDFESPLVLKVFDDKAQPLIETSNEIGLLPNKIIRKMEGEHVTNNFNVINESTNLAVVSSGETSSIFYENIISKEEYREKYPPYIYLSNKPYKAIVLSSSLKFIDFDDYRLLGNNVNKYSIFANNDNYKFIKNSINYLVGDEFSLNLNNKKVIYNERSVFDEISSFENVKYAEDIFKLEKDIILKEKEIRDFKETNETSSFSMTKVKDIQIMTQDLYEMKNNAKVLKNKINNQVQKRIGLNASLWSLILPLIEILILYLVVRLYDLIRYRKVLRIFNEK